MRRVVLLIVAVLASQTMSSAQERRDASISGRVLGPTGNPHAGATVTLSTLDGMFRGESLAGATTNERGEFRFDALRGGRYVVKYELPCYTREMEEVNLEPGAAVRRETVLSRPSFITGRVLTPSLEPAAGVRIVAIPTADSPPPPRAASMTTSWIAAQPLSPCPGRTQPAGPGTTGSDGVYSIYVTPGSHYIRSSPSASGELMETFFPNARTEADATAIEVRDGETVRGVDIRMEPAAPSVAIQLIGADDGTVRNMHLSYGREDQRHRGSRTGKSAAPDDRGRLFIYDPRMPIGPMTVFAFAEGANGPLIAFGTADLLEHQPTELQLRLGAFAVVHGRVVRADGDDPIPAGVSVSLVPTGYVPRGHENTAFAAPAHTPFVAEGLAGYYRVEISPRTWQIRSVTDRGRVVDGPGLEIRPDDSLDLQIVVAPR